MLDLALPFGSLAAYIAFVLDQDIALAGKDQLFFSCRNTQIPLGYQGEWIYVSLTHMTIFLMAADTYLYILSSQIT